MPTPESPASSLSQLSSGLEQAVATAARSTVLVDARRHLPASGIVWSADGVIVAASHTIEREDQITVGLPDGKENRGHASWTRCRIRHRCFAR